MTKVEANLGAMPKTYKVGEDTVNKISIKNKPDMSKIEPRACADIFRKLFYITKTFIHISL